MKKVCTQFLLITFIISYACFGIMAYSRIAFGELLKQPIYLLLFVLGCLGPFIATLLVYTIHKEELGGAEGLWNKIKALGTFKCAVLAPFFLLLHYGLAILLRNVGQIGSVANFFKFLPIMLVLFGTQEVGWRTIVQPSFEAAKGFWKSTFITGLFCALWFLPLVYIPQFVVLPQYYLQFAAYIVGMGMLQTTIYKHSGNITNCILFATLFFSLSTVISLEQNTMLIVIAALDVIIASTYNSKLFIK